MGLIIRKKVSLEFLGDEYKDSFLIVRAVGVSEYENVEGTVRDEVIARFIEGKINQDGKLEDITKENITDLPGEVFVEAWGIMTGTLPKVVEESMNTLNQ
jgi:hypothetical protein